MNCCGEGWKRGQDFNPATCLLLFWFGRCSMLPSQFSPCVGESRFGLFTFPLCAKLSWFLAMNKMHTRSDAHMDIHACTHPHCLSCSVLHRHWLSPQKGEEIGDFRQTLYGGLKLPHQAFLYTVYAVFIKKEPKLMTGISSVYCTRDRSHQCYDR